MPDSPAPLLSLCMIVRNEAARLPACLRSIQDLVDETIIVDTGSADETRAVAEEHGARVLEHPWTDDFAAARNASIEPARGRWILFLDADEVLRCDEGFDLRDALQAAEAEGFDFAQVLIVTPDASGGQEEVRATRLFRNGRGVHFRYPVHEQLSLRGARGRQLPVTVLHLGCMDEEETRARQLRYLELLAGLPADDPHRIVFTTRGLVSLGRWQEVETWAQRGLEQLSSGHGALPRMLFHAAVAAFNRGDREATARWLRCGLELHPDHPDLHFVAMAHAAWMCKLGHHAIQDPAHALFGQVGDSRRFLPVVDQLLGAFGLGDLES